MIRHLTAAALAAVVALPLAAAPQSNVVATVNGEAITNARLNQLWDAMNEKLRAQYEKAGGKAVFLDNYLRKRLLLQEAAKKGFDKDAASPTLDPARESAIFDRYVREVIATDVVPDEQVRRFYDENPQEFRHDQQVKLRQIFVSTEGKSVEEARTKIAKAMAEIHEQRGRFGGKPDAHKLFVEAFAAAAQRYSEDPTASNGGAIGWSERTRFDPTFADAAFKLRPGVMSGIVESGKGLHLILVEDKRDAGVDQYIDVHREIREFLLARNASKVLEAMNRRAADLMAKGDVKVYRENIK